jgi:cyclopropane-fatty-acyl-phospholipid synthase
MDRAEAAVRDIIASTGIELGGSRPWDITVHDPRFYARVLRHGSLGLGESYMVGWWDCVAIDQMMTKLLEGKIEGKVRDHAGDLAAAFFTTLFNPQDQARAFRNGQAHYDIGNDLYQAMLDKRMTYTCGYWKDATTLDEAQEAKLDLVCKKIGLKLGQTVLDIGCGWGSFVKFAAEKYGATCVGVTVSPAQAELARQRCAGLPVEVRLQDYREMTGQYDHIISLGMFEHVGPKNYRTYMQVARRCLKDGGIFLLHSIGGNRSVSDIDPWMKKYIFPGAVLPSAKQISTAAEGLFVMEDWHNFGPYYDRTLLAWDANVTAHWDALKTKYDERFRRMWRFYLLGCAATFRARQSQLWQIVFSKEGIPGGYVSVR